jgi:hypothetical protein
MGERHSHGQLPRLLREFCCFEDFASARLAAGHAHESGSLEAGGEIGLLTTKAP